MELAKQEYNFAIKVSSLINNKKYTPMNCVWSFLAILFMTSKNSPMG